MKDNVEFKIEADGTICTVYQEGIEEFARDLGADGLKRSCRASNVEWEEVSGQGKGWTVRAAHDSELAIRLEGDVKVVSRTGPIVVYTTREAALEDEIKQFWKLLPPKESSNG